MNPMTCPPTRPPLPLAGAFQPVLSDQQLAQAIAAEHITSRDCTFTPAVTFWTFFTQLFHAGSSCRNALLRLLAARCGTADRRDATPSTGTYCKARKRLPEALLTRVARGIADRADEHAHARRWKGHAVKNPDGTTVSMPDTPANQKAYPQSRNQKPGVGFPLARLVVLISLATGCILRTRLGPRPGKGTGEGSLFAGMLDDFQAGDLVLADAGFSSFWLIASVRGRGAEYVGHLSSTRTVDGRRDHREVWEKRKSPRPPGLTDEQWAALPEAITVRRVWVSVERPGFRTTGLHLVTTLLDAGTYSTADLADLYRRRWQVELHFRTLKGDLRMGVLRCRTPDMVVKELAMTVVVFNAIRAVMVSAGEAVKRAAWRLSFTAAWQAIESFAVRVSCPVSGGRAWEALLQVIGRQVVDDRPNRSEPRVLKRRPKDCKYMTKPRHKYPRNTRSTA